MKARKPHAAAARGMRIAGGVLSALAIAMAVALAAEVISPHAVPAGVSLGAGSTLWIEGKSNLHEFECRSSQVTVAFTRDSASSDPAGAADLDRWVRSSGVRGLEVRVPVASLTSGKDGLDKNLRKDLRAEIQPEIEFRLGLYRLEPRGDTLAIEAPGVLRIAGRERPVTLHASVTRHASGLWLDGSQPLRMTDFGITPRTMMLGTLRVADPVVVRYHLLLVPAIPAAAR